MKKLTMIIAAIILLGLFSCNKDSEWLPIEWAELRITQTETPLNDSIYIEDDSSTIHLTGTFNGTNNSRDYILSNSSIFLDFSVNAESYILFEINMNANEVININFDCNDNSDSDNSIYSTYTVGPFPNDTIIKYERRFN